MYVPDTMDRLAEEEAYRRAEELVDDDGDRICCDYCSEDAIHGHVIFNPRDEVEGRSGVYTIAYTCGECYDAGYLYENYFVCEGCDKWYIINHSWDVVAVSTKYGYSCQACFAKNYFGYSLADVLFELETSNKVNGHWPRINALPDHELLWEGEYSGYSDFPGHTTLASVAESIREKAEELDLDEDTTIYPVVNHGYQFSVSLAVYY